MSDGVNFLEASRGEPFIFFPAGPKCPPPVKSWGVLPISIALEAQRQAERDLIAAHNVARILHPLNAPR